MEYTDYLADAQTELSGQGWNYGNALPKVERRYKDTVFRMLFQEKTALLSLYNAVNRTNFTNAEDLEITTLENAVYMGMKNDVSCVFAFELSLYEHQSTVNPNMPLRDLFYVAQQLQKLVSERNLNLYSSKPLQIPTPRFVVFYNGSANMPERKEHRLSNLFQKQMGNPELELIVTVYNINPGMNEELLEACRLLKEYVLFTTKVRENQKTMELRDAVHKAVDDCIREGVLAEFLKVQRAEVIEMCICEYDQEKHMQLIREENWEAGHAAGLTEGHAEGHAEGLTEGHAAGLTQGLLEGKSEMLLQNIKSIMHNKKLTAEEAMEMLDVPKEKWAEFLAKL